MFDEIIDGIKNGFMKLAEALQRILASVGNGVKAAWSSDRVKTAIAYILLVLVVFFLGHMVYTKYFKPDKAVVPESQIQVETPEGVQKAADKAGIKLEYGQAKEAAKEIRYIYETKKEPVYIVNTTGEKAPAAASEARKEAKADFAIITDKNNPDKQVKLEELKKDQPVELNQYNVQAYKPVIRTLTISPDIEGKKLEQINFSVSKKINKKGEYIGIGAGYDIIDKRALLNISYSW